MWEAHLDKLQFVYEQTKQLMDKHRPFVRCGCNKKLWPHQVYKCLYCEEAYCKSCAEIHFGKTVSQYKKEKESPKVPCCPDCHNTNLVLIRTHNLKWCPDCNKDIPWPLDHGQKPVSYKIGEQDDQ